MKMLKRTTSVPSTFFVIYLVHFSGIHKLLASSVDPVVIAHLNSRVIMRPLN